MSRKRALCILAALALVPRIAFSQEIVSAEKFFSDLSAGFGKVKDYEASFTWTQGKTVSRGKISYKSPVSLRMDFDDPKDQVLVIDGEKLTIFVPQYEVVLEQKYKKRGAGVVAAMASAQGLKTLAGSYSVAFLSEPTPVPLEEGSREQVWKLKLTPRGTTGFRQLILSTILSTKDALIRRIEGTTTAGDRVILDLTGVRTNQSVPDSRFQYDPPAYASVIPDFLFDPEE